MQYLEIIFNYFQTLVFAESAAILKQLLTSLSTNQFGLYFSALGISLSSMSHFNPKLTALFDEVVLIIFHQIRWLSILLTILLLLPIVSIISYDLYQHDNIPCPILE